MTFTLGKPVAIEPLLDDKVHTDVCFVLGKDKATKVEAHRALLSRVSKVFESMLAPPPNYVKNLQEIELPDIQEEVFLAVMDCVYTGATHRITPDNFASMLEAANQFQVLPLQTCLISYLESGEHFTPKTLLAVLPQFKSLVSKEAEFVWQYLEQQAQVIIALPSFSAISYDVLEGFLKREYLSCSEINLFNAVLQWGVTEVARKKGPEYEGKTPAKEEVKDAIASLIPLIRFPTMTQGQLLQVAASAVLTDEELVSLS